MKTFQQFVEGYKGEKKEKSIYARYKKINDPQPPTDPLKPVRTEAAALAIPAAAKLAPYVLPAIGAAANLMKGAQPRKPSVQRAPDMSAAARQKRQAQQDRRAQAADRRREREAEASKKIDDLIGTQKDRAYAKQRRENPALRDAEAKQRTINDRRAAQRARMDAAAKKNNLGESVNISGDFNGNLYINSQPEQQVEESYVADILWEGNLYRLELKGRMPSKDELAENLQTSYPGALVQQIYPIVESELNIKSAKRYHPAKLDWV